MSVEVEVLFSLAVLVQANRVSYQRLSMVWIDISLTDTCVCLMGGPWFEEAILVLWEQWECRGRTGQ